MHLRGGLLCGVALILTATAFDSSEAQPASTTTASSPEVIETVVVTARRRAESEQSVPVAVTALSGDMISKLFVQSLADLDHQAPNFTIEGVGAIHRNAAVIYSRGIGYSGVDMGQDPAVGVSVNGVFSARNIGMLSNMQDVDHVEILRGPQGTLFGKNTVGGVVQVTTRRPGDTFDVELSGRIGNYGRADYFGAVDMPIDDSLAVRVSYLRQDWSGPFVNAYTGPVQHLLAPMPTNLPLPKHLGGANINTLRGTAVWTPFANFEAVLVASYMKDRSPSVGGQNGSTPTDALTFFGHPGYFHRTPGLPYPLGPNPPYVVYRNFPSGDFQDSTSVSLNLRYHTDDFDIVSVSGYMHDSNLSLSDYDDVELNFFQSTFGLHNKQASEELRIESNDNGSPLKWVVGGLYMSRTWNGTQRFYSLFGTLNNHIDYSQQADDSWAGFAQVDYTVMPGLEVTAGARYTAESKDIFRVPSHFAPSGSPGTFFFNKTWSNVSYKLGADYHIDDDKMVYGSFSTGFVAGGFNSRVDTAALTGLPYSPEKVDAWEIGFKSDWYEHRLRVNVDAFSNKYSGLQVGAFIPGGGLQQAIVNNGFERAQGAEAEVTAIPLENLNLSASIGYLDAHYTSFFADVLGTGAADFSHLKVARAPKWTARFDAYYDFNLGDNGTITPDVSYSYESSHFTDLTNSPSGFQKSYGVVDASISYVDPSSRWKVALWGKNLTNQLRILSAVPSSGFFTQLYFDNPMTFGVDLSVKLDGDTFK